jgi:predicted molibdopterin-dependent oxidoreductase YjgC
VEMQGDMAGSDAPRRIENHPVLGERRKSDPIHVTVDGQQLTAIPGEPIAASILAWGIRRFRTMPETHSPRGLFCGIGRCSDCLMTVDGVLNVRACLTPVRDGQVIETQRGAGVWKAGS